MPEDLERNAEYQRRKRMSQDERNITARDNLAKEIKLQNEKWGKNMTYDEAQRKATEIAHKVERRKGG